MMDYTISVEIKYLFSISRKEKYPKIQTREEDESIDYLHKLLKYPSNEIKI